MHPRDIPTPDRAPLPALHAVAAIVAICATLWLGIAASLWGGL